MHPVLPYLPSSFEARAPWHCCVCVCACACWVEAGTEQQAELKLWDQIWNGRGSHSSSCSHALSGSHSNGGQPQGHTHREASLLPLPFNLQWWLHGQGDNAGLSVVYVYVFLVLCGARMRMKELSLRQDPDLRKELALLARGCDFVLPSRFKKRLRAFQQGQAGVCVSVCCVKQALLAFQWGDRSINVDWYLWAYFLGIQMSL